MIAVDTNVLVYAHREDSPHHHAARNALRDLARGHAARAVPWPCVHEFLAVVTHPRIYVPPTPMPAALAAVDAIAALPAVRLLGETTVHLDVLQRLLSGGGVTGPRVHDARIASICIAHGVSELWSADRDFSWFPELRTVNPLVG